MRNPRIKMEIKDIFYLLQQEELKAEAKHGTDGEPVTRERFMSILAEEVGEAATEINKCHSNLLLQAEVIQIASVCIRFLQGTLRWSTK